MTSVYILVQQHVSLSATLRRRGKEVSKPPAHLTAPQFEDPDLRTSFRGCKSWPLYRSPCPHTRIFSTLIILHTVTEGSSTEHTLTRRIFSFIFLFLRIIVKVHSKFLVLSKQRSLVYLIYLRLASQTEKHR